MTRLVRACALIALIALLAPAAADAATKKSLTVKLSNASQERLLRAGAVPVRVKTTRAGRVRVTATIRETGVRAKKWRRVAITQVLRFAKRGSKTTRLRLTPDGRKRLEACGGGAPPRGGRRPGAE